MRYVIIGNGPAGAYTANWIRKKDPDGQITIVSDESYPLYSRPGLPDVLSGSKLPEKLIIFPIDWYKKNNIELILNTKAASIDTESKNIITDSNISLDYDKLMIATGGKPNRIPVDGIDGKNIFTLRNLNDVAEIKSAVENNNGVIVIGGGLLGLETAYSFVLLNKNVTVIEYFNRLLPGHIDEEGSYKLQELLECLGLNFILGAEIKETSDYKNKKRVLLKSGRQISTDIIQISAGITPAVDFIRNTKLKYGRGIIVNSHMETNIRDIYCAGDSAEYNGRIYGLWQIAMKQGITAGKNMAGDHVTYKEDIPVVKLKVAGINIVSIGETELDGLEEHRLNTHDTNSYNKIFTLDGTIKGAILIGDISLENVIKEDIGKDFSIIRNNIKAE